MFKLDSFEKKINLITGFVILSILIFVYREFNAGINQRSHEALVQINDIHADLRTESQLITKFVITARRFAENYFLFSRNNTSQWYSHLKYDKNVNGYYLHGLSNSYRQSKMGNLTALSKNLESDPDKKMEVNMALELGSYFSPGLMEIKSSPWFYYTSNDFMYLSPYLEPKDFFFSKKFLEEKEFYKNATPNINPERKGFWTSVYVDEAGLGLMVTYSEPVYDGSKFKGSVSMDITIDQFNSVLRRRDYPIGTTVLFNHKDQILADPSLVGSFDKRISKASDIIPEKLIQEAKKNKDLKLQRLVKIDSNYVFYEDFPELNSTLIFFISTQQLMWLTLEHLWPLFLFSLLCILLILRLRGAFLNDFLMQQNLIQNAKMSALGRMASGMAHEINNPLAIIVGKANGLKRLVDSEKSVDTKMLSTDLGKILSTSQRIAKIINSLRSFSRNGEQDPFFETNLKSWLNETLELCRQTFASQEINLIVNEVPDLKIMSRESQLSQVLLNLLNNSVDAVKEKQKREIELSFEVTKSHLFLYVRDSGDKIALETQARLMEPFFTTKSPGAGTGLGLSISLGIMKEHNGDIRFVPDDSKTCFVMEIPLA